MNKPRLPSVHSKKPRRMDGGESAFWAAAVLWWLLVWCCFGTVGSKGRRVLRVLRVSGKTTRGWAWAGEGHVCPLHLGVYPAWLVFLVVLAISPVWESVSLPR